MAATCAACLGPIAKGERFVLSRTEVFHARCVTAIARSMRAKLEQEVIRLGHDVSQLADDQRRLTETANAASRRADSVSRLLEREREEGAAKFRASERAKDAAIRDRDISRARADQLETERDAARRELAVMRQYGTATTPAPAATPAPAPTAVEPAKDQRDDSEIRFSLLEIDPT